MFHVFGKLNLAMGHNALTLLSSFIFVEAVMLLGARQVRAMKYIIGVRVFSEP